MQTRQRDVAARDSKYWPMQISTIEELLAAVFAGDKRLRLNVTCQPVLTIPGEPGMNDATGPGPTDSAEGLFHSQTATRNSDRPG
ncbi:hypothetical protein RI049_15635 [Cedecea neteri]|nr:hypothetical protein [Cedecea neteri]WPU21494.1 hypothetical protein RI049_15635 [Cedecea neteri]